MSDKKILSVNPAFFSTNKRSTRKKRADGGNNNKIKVKSVSPKKKNDNTLKKKSILKMIRQHQEDKYKKLFDDSTKSDGTNKQTPKLVVEELEKGFKDAKVFLQNLADKKQQEDTAKNYTIKHQPSIVDSIPTILSEPVIYNNIVQPVIAGVPVIANLNRPPMPQYGCLKNGSLPNYRSFMNKTRSNQPIITIGGNSQTASPIVSVQSPVINVPQIAGALPKSHSEIAERKINDSLKRVSEMKQTAAKLKDMNKRMKSVPKRKKTLRRTYKIGKSKVLPRVSVLVSNRTIRNNISTKSQLLKQVDMSEVKKYLIKRGFIKVGSSAPNDVLRKMYEEAVLMCGELQNHNPENLLYNFMNQKES
jgi:hypothetical protein